MLSTAGLGYLAIDDPVLYDWLNNFSGAYNALQQAVGVDTAAASQASGSNLLSSPAAPVSLTINASGGVYQATIKSGSGVLPGAQYFLEASTDTKFSESATTVYALGNSLVMSLNLGAGPYYFRCRAKYSASGYSNYTYYGSASSPTSADAGTAVKGVSLYTGTADPTSATPGNNGDVYISSSDKTVWWMVSGTWTAIGTLA